MRPQIGGVVERCERVLWTVDGAAAMGNVQDVVILGHLFSYRYQLFYP
jgi:hypothetical protein